MTPAELDATLKHLDSLAACACLAEAFAEDPSLVEYIRDAARAIRELREKFLRLEESYVRVVERDGYRMQELEAECALVKRAAVRAMKCWYNDNEGDGMHYHYEECLDQAIAEERKT